MAEDGEGGRGVFLWVCLLRKNAGKIGRVGEEEKSVCMCIHKTTEKICRQMYAFFEI